MDGVGKDRVGGGNNGNLGISVVCPASLISGRTCGVGKGGGMDGSCGEVMIPTGFAPELHQLQASTHTACPIAEPMHADTPSSPKLAANYDHD